MVKNVGGGKKKKRGAKFSNEKGKREMVFRGDDQDYGFVEKMLGDMRCKVICSNKTSVIAHIRGRFKRRVWINQGDFVLVSFREFEDEKADIIYKYNQEEMEYLKSSGLLDPEMILNPGATTFVSLDEEDPLHEDDEMEINLQDL